MTEFEEHRKLVVGRTLTNLFFTEQDGPHDHMPGLFPAYYFLTIMELDNTTKLCFGHNYVDEWMDEVPLITLTNENWQLPESLVFKGQKIVDLTTGEEEQLMFHLDNGTTITHTIDYGDKLFIENPAFTKDAQQMATYDFATQKKKQTWWQKLLSSQ